MTNEMKCQNRSASTEHSRREDNPEMFRTQHPDGERVECLAHAARSESRGLPVQIILT